MATAAMISLSCSKVNTTWSLVLTRNWTPVAEFESHIKNHLNSYKDFARNRMISREIKTKITSRKKRVKENYDSWLDHQVEKIVPVNSLVLTRESNPGHEIRIS